MPWRFAVRAMRQAAIRLCLVLLVGLVALQAQRPARALVIEGDAVLLEATGDFFEIVFTCEAQTTCMDGGEFNDSDSDQIIKISGKVIDLDGGLDGADDTITIYFTIQNLSSGDTSNGELKDFGFVLDPEGYLSASIDNLGSALPDWQIASTKGNGDKLGGVSLDICFTGVDPDGKKNTNCSSANRPGLPAIGDVTDPQDAEDFFQLMLVYDDGALVDGLYLSNTLVKIGGVGIDNTSMQIQGLPTQIGDNPPELLAEPGSLVLLAGGLIALLGAGRRGRGRIGRGAGTDA